MTQSLPSAHHYIRFSVFPPTPDPLALRKVLQDALDQNFGITLSGTYLDVLWVAEDGSECIIRAKDVDAAKVVAAVVPSGSQIRLSISKESPFLPSLLCSNSPFGNWSS